MRIKLPIVPGNKTPPVLWALPVRRYRLVPAEDPYAYAWIDLAEIRPRYWTAGYGTGLRRATLAMGCGIEHQAQRWPNAHNAWFACLGEIAEFWRRVPAELQPAGVRDWIEWLLIDDFEGLFAPMRITFLE